MDNPALGSDGHIASAPLDRREHLRVRGPFDGIRVGLLEVPLQIFDLGLGGCFVIALHEQQEGVIFTMRVRLPGAGWIPLKGQALYRRDGGFAVRFLDMGDATREQLARALERHCDERSGVR